MTTKPGRKPSGITSVYISVRLPLSIAQALHVLAASKKTSRNKLIGDVLRAVASEVQE
jgi:predicted HicB family RNase H-like nuclease